jgi:hypothetical protein
MSHAMEAQLFMQQLIWDNGKQLSAFLITGLISIQRTSWDLLLFPVLLKKAVDLLVLCGADLNLANIEGSIPLMKAAQNGHLEIVKLIVEKEAVVEQASIDGTVLSQASLAGHLEVADYLLSAGANIHYLNVHGICSL